MIVQGQILGSNTRRLVLAAIALLCGASVASAASITVDTTADDAAVNGNCTLREAVIAANTDTAVDGCAAGNGIDAVALSAGTYLLTEVGAGEDAAATGDLDLTEDVSIVGLGAAITIIDGNQIDRVLDVDPGNTGVTAVLTAVTIRNGGNASGAVTQGGGIRAAGALAIIDSVITANAAQGGLAARGGGIDSTGTLAISGSVVSSNTVTPSLCCMDTIAAGGGIWSSGSTTITTSTIADNTAAVGHGYADGGGIFSTGPLLVTASTIRDNTTSVDVFGTASGGAVATGTTAALTVANSTISGNRAQNTGHPTPLSLGGAMTLLTDALISNSTIADNSSLFGAVSLVGDPTVTFRNTILGDNLGTSNCDTAFFTGTIVADAYNLDDDGSCGFSGTDLVGVDPLLGPLQDNGGPTATHLLLEGSPAIEGGSPAVPGSGGDACEIIDQRGIVRPQFARCDIGSVEVVNSDACAAPPLGGCDTPGKTLVVIKDRDADGSGPGDKLIWKWLKGPATTQADFGDPTATADYTLCIYAGTAAVMRADVPAGGTCGAGPCWSALGTKGYKRKDSLAASSGITKVLLKGSDGANAKVLVKGKGAGLDLDAATLPLDAAGGMTVQLSNSDNDNCWQATYAPESVKKNSETVFKAKSP